MGAKELLGQAILTAQRGLPDKAREMFHLVLITEPRNEHAWVWLTSIAADDAEREECLRQVVAINPQHPSAAADLQQLIEKRQRDLSAQVAALVSPPIDLTPPAAAPVIAPARKRGTLSAGRKPIRPRQQRLILYVGGGSVIVMLAIALIALVANRSASPIVPTATHTLTFTPTVPPTWTRTFTPSPTLCPPRVCTPTPTLTPTSTSTRTSTPTRTVAPTRTPTVTRTVAPTRTPTVTRTSTSTKAATPTKTATPTVTYTATATRTPTVTVTRTVVALPSPSPSPSRTPTVTVTRTVVALPSPSPSPSPSATRKP